MKNWFNLIPLALTLMHIAEEALGAGAGASKKEMVVEGMKLAVDAMKTESTGGQKSTWEKIAEPINKLIDLLACFFFPNKEK